MKGHSMTELETYDTEQAHNMWHDGHVVFCAADPLDPDYTVVITEAHQFVDLDGHLFIIEL
jgi:hypothetical protein